MERIITDSPGCKITAVVFERFKLDGGAMFGSVPKAIWNRLSPADEKNRIQLVTRCLYVELPARRFLIDVGIGSKMTDKEIDIYEIIPTSFDRTTLDPTDIILTHFHFDHAGGITTWEDGCRSNVKLSWPNARIHVQKANQENAQKPNKKEKASYFPENVKSLELTESILHNGTSEVYPGISVHRSDGHTVGLQWIEIEAASQTILFPSDLLPTSAHLHPAFTMGYDMCAATVLDEKEQFIAHAIQKNAVVVYQHDPIIAAQRLEMVDGKLVGRDLAD
jgi:glyoxylase-like metal-dependent hydrolase (beta-lactamase superfamily II)